MVEDALAAYKKVIALDEEFDLAYDAIGQLYREEGNGNGHWRHAQGRLS